MQTNCADYKTHKLFTVRNFAEFQYKFHLNFHKNDGTVWSTSEKTSRGFPKTLKIIKHQKNSRKQKAGKWVEVIETHFISFRNIELFWETGKSVFSGNLMRSWFKLDFFIFLSCQTIIVVIVQPSGNLIFVILLYADSCLSDNGRGKEEQEKNIHFPRRWGKFMILLPGKKKICLKWLSGSLCWILLYWWSWNCMQPGRRHWFMKVFFS